SEGSPFLITQLANLDAAHHVVRLRDVLRDRVQQLPNGARAVLEVVSVAGGPIARGVVLDAAGVGEAGRPLVAALHRERLLRIVGSIRRRSRRTTIRSARGWLPPCRRMRSPGVTARLRACSRRAGSSTRLA